MMIRVEYVYSMRWYFFVVEHVVQLTALSTCSESDDIGLDGDDIVRDGDDIVRDGEDFVGLGLRDAIITVNFHKKPIVLTPMILSLVEYFEFSIYMVLLLNHLIRVMHRNRSQVNDRRIHKSTLQYRGKCKLLAVVHVAHTDTSTLRNNIYT